MLAATSGRSPRSHLADELGSLFIGLDTLERRQSFCSAELNHNDAMGYVDYHLSDVARLCRQTAKVMMGRTAPLEAAWDVTYRCNARCSYCGNWRLQRPTLPLRDVAKLIERVARLGTFQMSLSGGEPLMRRDIVEIVGMIKRAEMRCSVVSNGSLGTEDVYRRLMKAGLDTLVFSVDGATREAHEHFRHGTSFDRVIESIRTCVRLKRKHHFATRIATGTVLTNANVEEIPRIARLVRSCGVEEFKFQPVWNQQYGAECSRREQEVFNDTFGFTRSNEPLLRRAMALAQASGTANDPDFTAMFSDFYFGTERAQKSPCYALRAFLFIDPEGNVFPCAKVRGKVGNILDDSWEDPARALATPENARRIRALTAKACGGCAAIATMERNVLLESVKSPLKLARIAVDRVLRAS